MLVTLTHFFRTYIYEGLAPDFNKPLGIKTVVSERFVTAPDVTVTFYKYTTGTKSLLDKKMSQVLMIQPNLVNHSLETS